MHKFDYPKIKAAIERYEALEVARTATINLRDFVKSAGAGRLILTVPIANIPPEEQLVRLKNGIQSELHEWLVQRLTEEVAALARAQERIVSPAGDDLHAKNGAKT